MNELRLHPVDWYNLHGKFKDIFRGDEAVHMKSDKEACYPNSDDMNDSINNPTFVLQDSGAVVVMKANSFDLAKGSIVSKFTLLTFVKFKGDYRGADSFVMYKLMELELPYVRIGTDYYAIEKKPDRYGGEYTTLKVWKKDTITEDHTKSILKMIPKYQDFIIAPDNKSYSPVHGRYYNLYSEFPHKPLNRPVTESDIPTTLHLYKHHL